MQLTFAGTIIAQEATEGGTDAITGFIPERQANTEWAEFLRAVNSVPLDRFNRKRTLSGVITPAPYPNLAAAAAKLLMNLDTLPNAGVLIVTVGGESFPATAVLKTVKAVKRMGVTVAAQLTFETGPFTASGSPNLQDQTGSNLTDQTGAPLTSQ